MNKDKLIKDLIQKVRSLQSDLDEVCYAYSCVLDHATGGKMSKPYVDVQRVCSVIDDHVSDHIEDIFNDLTRSDKHI